MTRVLFIGDVMGSPGRRAVSKLLVVLRSRIDAHIVIANGENSAGGLGITKSTATELFDAGVDVITLGNHAFSKRETNDFVISEPRILRPANFPPGVPGRGWGIFNINNHKLAVANLLGRTFMVPVDCPFRCADAIIDELKGETKAVLFDMHAEATSEKKAMSWYLDGRASAVIGTHTHVQTSDEIVMPEGTAYITDAGMTGVHDSVLGMDKATVIARFLTQVTNKFVLADGPTTLQGAAVDIDEDTGRALRIERVSEGEL